jgi:hypothetical protein
MLTAANISPTDIISKMFTDKDPTFTNLSSGDFTTYGKTTK